MPEVSFQRIAVAIDGSSNGRVALDVAIDLTKRYGSDLVVISIAPLIPVYVTAAEPYIPSTVPQDELARYRAIVNEAVQYAEKSGVTNVTGLCDEGVVVDEVLAYLEQHPSDLLVVGSRGLSTARRLLLGSVSSALVNNAPCPVLVVRPTATKPTSTPQ